MCLVQCLAHSAQQIRKGWQWWKWQAKSDKSWVRPVLVLQWDVIFSKKDWVYHWVYHSIKQTFTKLLPHASSLAWNCDVKAGIIHDIELYWTRTKFTYFTKKWTRTAKYSWMKLEHMDILVRVSPASSCLDAPEPEVKGRGNPEYPITLHILCLSPSPPRGKNTFYPETKVISTLNSGFQFFGLQPTIWKTFYVAPEYTNPKLKQKFHKLRLKMWDPFWISYSILLFSILFYSIKFFTLDLSQKAEKQSLLFFEWWSHYSKWTLRPIK